MNTKAWANLREIVDAIDILNDHRVIGDSEADSMFINHLNEIDVSIEEYWDYYGEKCPTYYTFLGHRND